MLFGGKRDIINLRKAPVTGRIASRSISSRREVRPMAFYDLIILIIMAAGVLVDLVACVVAVLSFLKEKKDK